MGSRKAERVYDGFYAAVYDEIYLSDKYTNGLERIRPVLASLGPEDRILDSGCGTGTFCGLLRASHPLVEGLDLSPHMRERPGASTPA